MSTLNPVDLWKQSLGNRNGFPGGSDISTIPIFLSPSVVSSFSGDANYFRKMFKAWPIKMERKAVFWPAHATFIACGTAGTVIGIRVNSYTFLGDANHSYAESLRKCPKLTWLIALYSSALFYFGINENTVSRFLYSHGDLCNTCLILGSITTALLGGICFPMLSTPYLTAAAAILQGDDNAIPKLRKTNNWLNYLFRWKVGVNACRGILLPMTLGLSAISGASMYVRLWGRERIMDTLSVEPEFVAEMD
uniref:Transmembrane protein 126A n=1 Tax=Elaeophora elaphi TaxID=1147741 RepID=A0A0R3RRJ0_9BILA